MLFAIDPDKDFINVEGIAEASVLSLQSSGINSSKFDTPETDRFATDGDTSLSEKIFDISMAQVEAIVEPDGVGDDIWRESVALVGIHGPILLKPAT